MGPLRWLAAKAPALTIRAAAQKRRIRCCTFISLECGLSNEIREGWRFGFRRGRKFAAFTSLNGPAGWDLGSSVGSEVLEIDVATGQNDPDGPDSLGQLMIEHRGGRNHATWFDQQLHPHQQELHRIAQLIVAHEDN